VQTTPLLLIRPAKPSDARALANLLADSFEPSGWWRWTQGWWRLGLAQDLEQRLTQTSCRYVCLVAILDGRLVGTVELTQRPLPQEWWRLPPPARPDDPIYISNLAVDLACRRQGIATGLLREAEAVAQQWQQIKLYLHVMADNPAALRLYRRFSYEVERSERTWPLWAMRPMSKLLMSKNLACQELSRSGQL